MSEEQTVDLNTVIRLMRVPTNKYPKEEDGIFQIKMIPPPPIDTVPEGSVVVKNMYISIDATMRVWISGVKSYLPPVKPNDVMRAFCVGTVIYSKSQKLKVGDVVSGMIGWQKYTIMKGQQLSKIPKQYPYPQHFLGVLGISGLTAYFGLHKIGKIKSSDVVVISAAAGAVGEIAIQLAKNQGCYVCGIAGGEQKCKYIKSIGADCTIDYKKDSIRGKLKQLCPQGVDVYFDNVGGQMLDDVLMHINQEARVVMCGTISSYSDLGKPYRLKNYSRLIIKRAIMEGFLYFDYVKQFKPAIQQMLGLMKEGKLKTRIDMQYGIQQCPAALKKLLTGQNNGKVIVKVEDDRHNLKPKL